MPSKNEIAEYSSPKQLLRQDTPESEEISEFDARTIEISDRESSPNRIVNDLDDRENVNRENFENKLTRGRSAKDSSKVVTFKQISTSSKRGSSGNRKSKYSEFKSNIYSKPSNPSVRRPRSERKPSKVDLKIPSERNKKDSLKYRMQNLTPDFTRNVASTQADTKPKKVKKQSKREKKFPAAAAVGASKGRLTETTFSRDRSAPK